MNQMKMMTHKKILITAGPVYGKIDDNKIISNRARGIWAAKLAHWLAQEHSFQVYLVLADTMRDSPFSKDYRQEVVMGQVPGSGWVQVITHQGYFDYAEICSRYAGEVDAAIMAAAVLNYIPETTYVGKLPADKEHISLNFILAPKVINEMKKINPRMTLIGCKLLFSDDEDKLIDAAYKVVLDARCNMVIANDGNLGLKTKYLVHQDKTVIKLENDFDGLYGHILSHIQDVHWSTSQSREGRGRIVLYGNQFESVIEKYQHKFIKRLAGKDFVFGSVAVRYTEPGFEDSEEFLISPREKGGEFNRWDGVVCSLDWDNRVVNTWANHAWDEEKDDLIVRGKATLNAPLLARHLKKYPQATAVVHYHAPVEEDIGIKGLLPVVPHAPPGTARDNEREIPGPCYYIEGHGWIIALDENFEPLRL